MNKLKNWFLKIYYGLPFGLKGADTEIMGASSSEENGTNIMQEATDERVAKHLLKGEVTQEVEELRYRTYKVSDESENYSYVGNGVAVKDKDNKHTFNGKLDFSQENSLLCASVLSELEHLDDYGSESYRLNITYNDIVRFKLEQFATAVDVYINEETGTIETTLRFEKTPNPTNVKSKPFVMALKALSERLDEYSISRNELVNSIDTLSFVTYKARNEDSLVTYAFTKGAKFKELKQTEHEYLLVFSWDEYTRVPTNLEVKYYSKTMDEKYKRKERKNTVVDMVARARTRYCSICGKEMPLYDADIQEYDGDMVICQECMAKAMLENNSGKQEEK